MGIIATENDARTIGGSSASYTSNLCATKARAEALNCIVSGNYANNLLVLLSDLSSRKNYLKFTTTSSGTFTFTGNNLDYSTNGGASWTTLQSGSATPSFNSGTEVVWRFTKSDNGNRLGTFSSTCSFIASGNSMSLLYGDNFENLSTLMTRCFESLFESCLNLTSASSLLLPATTLASYCYYRMFYSCEALTGAPTLPATTLADHCYQSMFYKCIALTSAPALPATNLASDCYSYMFWKCASLRSAPTLPATSLASFCYSFMFEECTALTSAPVLPATTLADYCYSGMFLKCTSLVNPPALPATTLASKCYNHMFLHCTSLGSMPTLPASILLPSCYSGMFSDCTSLTLISTLSATTLADYCYSGMFQGCTALATVPSTLPSTTLNTGCYEYMFSRCTSLRSAPILPATTLVTNCYRYMFLNCSLLNNISCYATSISASNCTTNWVNGVATTGTFTQASGVSWSRGVDGIPSTWMVMEPLPELGTCTIENYGIFLSDFGYNSNILSVTFLYLISIVATPDIDAVAQSERYRPTLIALYKAGKSYPLTWSSLEGAYALKPYSSITIDAPWVEDGYNTDIHIVIGTNAGLTGSLCYLNNGLALTFDDTVIPYLASYFKMNGVYPVVLNEETPCCLSSSGNGRLSTYIPY